ncbi:hypothetical protein [Roseisolibacter agri]|nr:hypothetical protein [Roseisolibacter agri]
MVEALVGAEAAAERPNAPAESMPTHRVRRLPLDASTQPLVRLVEQADGPYDLVLTSAEHDRVVLVSAARYQALRAYEATAEAQAEARARTDLEARYAAMQVQNARMSGHDVHALFTPEARAEAAVRSVDAAGGDTTRGDTTRGDTARGASPAARTGR